MRLLPWLAGPLAAGPPVGLAWWLLAPTAPVRVVAGAAGADGSPLVVAPGAPELAAAQDGTLLLLGVAAGVLTGLVVVARGGARPAAATALAAAGALLGAALAAWLGQQLGPDPLAAQRADGGGGALTSPLAVHAPGVLLAWPAAALVVSTLGHALLARGGHRPPAGDGGGALP